MKVRNIKVVSCEDTNIDDSVVDELYYNCGGDSVYGRFFKVEFLKGLVNDYVEELDWYDKGEDEFDVKVRGVLEEVNKLDSEWYVEFK